MTRCRVCVGVLALVAMLLAGFGDAASAVETDRRVNVSCGQTITQNTTLLGDVGPCPGDGIIIGADGIILNLNGHKVVGASDDSNNSVGVRLPGRTGTTVLNGTVSNFAAGVAILGGSGNKVADLVARDNIGQEFGDFGDGITIMSSQDNTVIHSVIRHNGPFDGIGVFGETSTGNRISKNRVVDNNTNFVLIIPKDFMGRPDFANCPCRIERQFSDDVGINLGFTGGGGSNRTIVSNNVVRDSGKSGITACSEKGNPCVSSDNVIIGNLVVHNGFGIPGQDFLIGGGGNGIRIVGFLEEVALPGRNFVSNNRVVDNYEEGIFVYSLQNRIIDNYAVGNDLTIDVPITDLRDITQDSGGGIPDCDANIWRRNTYGTAMPSCTTIGGRQIAGPSQGVSGAEPRAAASVSSGAGEFRLPGGLPFTPQRRLLTS